MFLKIESLQMGYLTVDQMACLEQMYTRILIVDFFTMD